MDGGGKKSGSPHSDATWGTVFSTEHIFLTVVLLEDNKRIDYARGSNVT